MTFTAELLQQASDLLAAARAKGLKIATAESCTGGLIAGLLTEIPGSSDVFERGFVTYSNQAKMDLLGVPEELLKAHGAVSLEVAYAMAFGALRNSRAHLAVAVTGIAGPGGGTTEKPVGLVVIASCFRAESEEIPKDPAASVFAYRFGDIGRTKVRLATVKEVLDLLFCAAS